MKCEEFPVYEPNWQISAFQCKITLHVVVTIKLTWVMCPRRAYCGVILSILGDMVLFEQQILCILQSGSNIPSNTQETATGKVKEVHHRELLLLLLWVFL